MTIVGFVVVACLAAVAILWVYNPFANLGNRGISVTIDTPYVGQGVVKGSAVVMRGVKVGEVTAVSSLSGGGVRLGVDLAPGPALGLTNTMNIDFRSINYFGVTGINVTPSADGQVLRNGMQINAAPKGNFTLQALLFRLGEISTGVLTPQMIQVVDRATRYVDGLDPLIETMLITANSVAEIQTVSTAQLLANTTDIAVPYPQFVDGLSEAGYRYIHPDEISAYHTNIQQMSEAGFEREKEVLKFAAVNIFGTAGKLLSSHVPDLLPTIETVKALTDVVPGLIRPEGVAQMLVELRTRLEKLYGGTPEQRALQVKIVLDSLPGVAAPLAAIGGP